MAGGKETPRQKMIGMMYLVLTALLALNVASTILDAFVAIEENIQVANENEYQRGREKVEELEEVTEDETQPDMQKKAKMLMDWLQSGEAPKHVVLTCRKGDYEYLCLNTNISQIIIKTPNRDQVEQFTYSYLTHGTKKFLKLITESGDSHPGRSLQRLSQNPYMLSALIFLFQNSLSGELPYNQGDLFRRLVRALWARENQRGIAADVVLRSVETDLAELAYQIIDANLATSVDSSIVEKYLNNPSAIKVSISANFLSQSSDRCSSYHQRMQNNEGPALPALNQI